MGNFKFANWRARRIILHYDFLVDFFCPVTSEPKNAIRSLQLHLCTENELWFVVSIFIFISSLFV